MKTPFFSIIIPAYNVGTLIIECIESLFCQTFRDFEIIIVDDGSSDDTFDVCESLHIKYTSLQITLLHQTTTTCSQVLTGMLKTMMTGT